MQIASVKPSDASHAMVKAEIWDRAVAEKALQLFGRRHISSGDMLATNAQQMAQIIVDQLTQQTVLALLQRPIIRRLATGWEAP